MNTELRLKHLNKIFNRTHDYFECFFEANRQANFFLNINLSWHEKDMSERHFLELCEELKREHSLWMKGLHFKYGTYEF